MARYNLFMVGGAKGTGKTRLTLDVSSELGLGRIETGKLVFDYIFQGLPIEGLTDYITQEILSQDRSLILDTHYARYSDKEEPNKQFRRGLEPENLERLLEKFDIFPCLLEVPPYELEQRRRNDPKKRIINPFYIMQEIEFNRKGYELYLKEINKKPFILMNNTYINTRNNLIDWISKNGGGLTVEKRFGLGSIIYVFNKDLSKVLLLKLNETKRSKFGADWGNVGGKINLGETSLENCIREAEEEIGVTFKPGDLKLLYVKENPNFFNRVHGVQFVYATSINEQTPIAISSEVDSYQWFGLSNLPDRTLDTKEDFYNAVNLFNRN